MRNLDQLRLTLVGCGALGSAILQLIGRLDFEEIDIIDGDIVTEKNVKTQVLYDIRDTKTVNYKADVAKIKFEDINSRTKFKSLPFYLTLENAEKSLKGSDIVIDATDNTKTRLIVNQFCIFNGIPLLEVTAKKKGAMVHLVEGDNACFNCLYSASKIVDNECAEIDQSLPPIVAGIALETLSSFIDAQGGDLKTTVISTDPLNISRVKIKKLETCEVCSKRIGISKEEDDFIQICGEGIKYSFSKRIMLHDIYLKLSSYGEMEGDNNYIILKNAGKSVLISDYGDLLFTGYDLDEARKFIALIKPLILTS